MAFCKPALLLPCVFVLAATSLRAQTVVVKENVRLDYAQVLAVEPVYQTLRATRMEQHCDPAPDAPKAGSEQGGDGEGGLSKIVGSVKGLFEGEDEAADSAADKDAKDGKGRSPGKDRDRPVRDKGDDQAPAGSNCRLVPVEREFHRPIAYDVDYTYKGTKYRSRLAEDPGNRLRIRVSVMPYVPEQKPAAP